MRRIMFSAAAVLLTSGMATADPATGLWQTQPDDNGNFGHVEIAPCGAMICGVLVRAYAQGGAPRESDHIGRQIVWDMTAEGDGEYGGGKIYSPDRDKTYRSKMALTGDRLSVSGCVGPICRTQTWARVR